METQQPEPAKHAKRNKNIGRILSIVSIIFSGSVRLWTAWLFPIVNTLGEQGRLHEGDSDGCFYGFLMVPTIFIAPFIILVAVVLALLGFHLKARIIAIVALVVAVIALIPLIPALMSFFGS